ncbi:MAG: type VI secretion system ATPase TssH [Novosphingobium sp.]
MTEISRASLFGRLNPTALKGIETATSFCKMRGNPYVELIHWLHVLLQESRNDLAAIRSAFTVDDTKLARDVVAALDALPRGASAISDFSPQIEEAIEKGWLYASLQFSASRVRTGHLLFGMLKTPTLKNALFAISPEFRKMQVEKLGAEFENICASSIETTQIDAGPSAAGSGGSDAGGGPVGEGEALAKFSIDLTEKARSGEIDKIVGRDAEIRQVVDILLRRRQNNPILVGEAGVGKTAVAEGFARRIVDGDVPPVLQGVTVRSLDIGLLQAGASVKGEFEKRLRQVIDEVESSTKPIILFIDEAHTLVGAGGQAGTGDAANLLKPALARGRLRTIAATTYAEYRQYFEKDPALTRRFQTVDVGEPDTENAVAMLRSVAPMMEKHHDVVLLDEAVEAAVKLSQRYVPARQLPDKAVSLLDTACARVAVSQHAVPAQVEDRRRRVELLEVEREIAAREQAGQYREDDRVAKIDELLIDARAECTEAETKWEAEKVALDGVKAARDALAAAASAAIDPQEGGGLEAAPAVEPAENGGPEAAPPADTAALKADLDAALEAMKAAQGDAPMVFGVADADAVASVVGDWTGIPVGRMVKNEIASVLTIADQLKTRVIGQDDAMDAIAKRIQTSRAKLDNPNKPVGVFMLCGPSGVGKTETAHVLSELLYSGDDSLIVINMSEFQEAHTVSTLKGAPAGYVGYGQGGVLTEAVRRRPYSVVHFQFSDMDILFYGQAVDDANRVFREFWNHQLSYSVQQWLKMDETASMEKLRDEYINLLEKPDITAEQLKKAEKRLAVKLKAQNLHWAKAYFVADSPAKITGDAKPEQLIYHQMIELIGFPTQKMELVSAYFVPTQLGTDYLGQFADRGVEIRVITNSFMANDIAVVHAYYQKYRPELLKKGIRLYEFKHVLKRNKRTWYEIATGHVIPAKNKNSSSLHAKFFDVDGKVFVGSFNFDPRSAQLNTEVGLVIESVELQQQISQNLDHHLPRIAYEVKLNEQRELIWLEQESNGQIKVHQQEPEMTSFQRWMMKLVSYLPFEWMM